MRPIQFSFLCIVYISSCVMYFYVISMYILALGLLSLYMGNHTNNKMNAVFKWRLQPRDEIICVFWDFLAFEMQGGWSSDGCTKTAFDDTYTLCSCNHTTNFAVITVSDVWIL